MSNMMQNRISATLTPEEMKKVKGAFQTLFDILPLVGLTTRERETLPKISELNKIFVEDSLMAMRNNKGFLPGYLEPLEVEKDITLFGQLDEVLQLSNQLVERVSDTQMLAGSEAFVTALTCYRLFEAAANAGLPGSDAIYNQLKQRFAGQGTPAAKPANKELPTDKPAEEGAAPGAEQ
jgi:hypothetical protein